VAGVSIQKRKTDKTLIFDIDGKIDLFSSPELRAQLLYAFHEDHQAIVLNFSGVTYIDSSGLATVIEGLQKSQKTRLKYALFGLSERVRSVFDVVKLTGAFSIHPDEATALEAVQDVKPPSE